MAFTCPTLYTFVRYHFLMALDQVLTLMLSWAKKKNPSRTDTQTKPTTIKMSILFCSLIAQNFAILSFHCKSRSCLLCHKAQTKKSTRLLPNAATKTESECMPCGSNGKVQKTLRSIHENWSKRTRPKFDEKSLKFFSLSNIDWTVHNNKCVTQTLMWNANDSISFSLGNGLVDSPLWIQTRVRCIPKEIIKTVCFSCST